MPKIVDKITKSPKITTKKSASPTHNNEATTTTYIIDETRKPWTIGYTIAFSASMVVGMFAIVYTLTGIIYKIIT